MERVFGSLESICVSTGTLTGCYFVPGEQWVCFLPDVPHRTWTLFMPKSLFAATLVLSLSFLAPDSFGSHQPTGCETCSKEVEIDVLGNFKSFQGSQ